MLKLKRLVLNNFLKHERLELAFPPSGIIPIGGPNGCGKSAVIRALTFALTGDLDIPRQAAVRWGATDGYVALTFGIGDHEYTVTRKVGSSGAMLQSSDGSVDLRAVAKVNEFLYNHGGVDAKRAQFCFVQQGRLTDLLDAPKSARIDTFNRLFETDRFDAVYDALAPFTNVVVGQDVADDIAVVTGRLAELGTALAKLESEVATLETQHRAALDRLGGSPIEAARALGTARSVQDSLRDPMNDLAALEAAVTRERETVAAATLAIEEEERRIAALNAASVSLLKASEDRSNVDATAARLNAAEIVNRLAPEVASLETRVAELRQIYETAHAAEGRLGVQLTELLQRRATDATLVAQLDKQLQSLGSNGTCPTCGTNVVCAPDGQQFGFDEVIARLRQIRDSGAEALASIDAAVASARAAVNSAGPASKAAADELNKVRNQLAARSAIYADAVAAVGRGPHDIDQLRAAHTEASEALALAKKRWSDCHAEINKALQNASLWRAGIVTSNHSIQSWSARVAKLRELSASPAATTDIPALEACLADYTAFDLRLKAATTLRDKARADQASDQRQLDTLRVTAAVNSKREELRELMAKLRAVFHRSGLPTKLNESYLTELQIAWNEALAALDVPFSVEIQADYEILLEFAHEQVRAPVVAASGGQKCCLALALLLAINRVMFSGFGVLVLDEPTYGLDRPHVDRLVELFGEMHSSAELSGLQVIVVTHEPRFGVGFDNHIRIGAA